METQTYSTQILSSDDPSPSEPLISREGLDGFPQLPPFVADSLSGSSSVSPMAVDSIDLETMLGNFIEEETVEDPLFPEAATFTNSVFSFTEQPPSCSSIEFEPSQLPALVPYDSKKALSSQEDREDPWEWLSSNYNSHQFNVSLENEHSAWTPWRPNPWVPPKEAFRTEDEPTGVGAGLKNLGNTCFMNAVLQCFTHTVPFVLGLQSLNRHEKPCDRDINSFCLLCALHDHIELSVHSSGGVVSPSKFFDNLNYISSSFQRYQQEDAHEFFQCLLNRLEVCCSDLKLKDDCLSSPDVCLVKKVFGGRLVSRLCCCNCGHISCSYEPFNDLSLEIEDVDTLPIALESFTKVEKLDDLVAKFKCENCKQKVSVEKQLLLDQAPSVATFHLKRFKTKGTYVEKIDKHVVFPLELDLQPYTSVNQMSNEELKYQLYAVVKHSGFRPTSGHYVCYIRSSPDTWHNFNDSTVTSVEAEKVLSEEAYILFYARVGIPWFSIATEIQKPGSDPGISDPSPKSVLDNIVCSSSVLVENNTGYSADECKDVTDKTKIQFSCETQLKLEHDKPSVTSKWISGLLVSEPEFHAAKSVDFRDDSPINEASLPPGSINCSDNFDKSISAVSNLGGNKSNQGSIDKATSDSTFPWTPFSQCPDKCPRNSSGKKPVINRRAFSRSLLRQKRTKARRRAKRMQGRRGVKFMALLASEPAAGDAKKSLSLSVFETKEMSVFGRGRRGKRKESKLGIDLSSPGSINLPKHVVIVMDGLQEFTTQLLEWVLQNICAPGYIVTLLGFMPWLNIPLYSKTRQDVWTVEFEHLSMRNDAKYVKLQAVLELCSRHRVTLQKETVMGYPLPSLIVERIISHRASWVVFNNDRYLRKNREYFAKKIPCNMVMMSEEGYMDMIKGRPMIDNGDNTPSESPASLVPTPLVICSEPLKRILEEQEHEKYVDDYVI
ncbi:hypothetical protein V6N13_046926 [Hibiscus sabdariffa]|uniref:Ubiquitin carboxyl-terminal hydrolase n=1 Tax=Hibiscus sabdariffa TaxID=183260 RepID=A0ABR2AC61_9ROSI